MSKQLMATDLHFHNEPYPPITDDVIGEIVKRIQAAGDPIRILLFGSRARGDNQLDSDLDIFILEDYRGNYGERQLLYSKVLEGVYPEITVIVRSPQEIEQWRYVPGALETTAIFQGKLLWEDPDKLRQLVNSPDGSLLVAEDIEYKTPAILARQIFEKATMDMVVCKNLLEHDEAFDMICFHAQQAAEKYLKGFIVLQGGIDKKTHDLQELINICNRYFAIPELQNLELKSFFQYAITARYDVLFWSNKDTAVQALKQAEHIIQAILKYVPPEARPAR